MDVVVVAVVMALIFLFICFPSLFAAGSPFMFFGGGSSFSHSCRYLSLPIGLALDCELGLDSQVRAQAAETRGRDSGNK
jgi:hypothetical protein